MNGGLRDEQEAMRQRMARAHKNRKHPVQKIMALARNKEEEYEELKNAGIMCKECSIEPATIDRKNLRFLPCTTCRARASRLENQYNISLKDYQKMLKQQGGNCAICDCVLESPHVDHCHDREHVRGLLCSACNTGIGMFKENTNALQLAIVYINRNKWSRKWWAQQGERFPRPVV